MSETTPIPRTQDEIRAYIAELEKDGDFFGFIRGDLFNALDYEHAKPKLKEDVTPETWAEVQIKTREQVLFEMEKYMPFAWEKANNMRGLSAGRAINHYQAWLWLIGEGELANQIGHYEFYGKPQLIQVCNKFGWDHKQWDDGVRDNGPG